MEFNDALGECDVNPAETLLMRHSPKEQALRKRFLWLAAERPDVVNAYQQTQNLREQKQLQKASYLAAFAGHQPGKALFIGLFGVNRWQRKPRAEVRKMPGWAEMLAYTQWRRGGGKVTVFDLQLKKDLSHFKGRLVVNWPGPELSWSRWASKNTLDIHCIHEESILVPPVPNWRECIFNWEELHTLPQSWQAAIRQWRGVYLIFDKKLRSGYVGSAYGEENIWGRWLGYAKSGHGGNKKLRRLEPTNFVFSILEVTSPGLSKQEVIELETSWKNRLHTKRYGLNEN